jgi:hypothetical protein
MKVKLTSLFNKKRVVEKKVDGFLTQITDLK